VSLPDTIQLVLAVLNDKEYRRATICTQRKMNERDVMRCTGERASCHASHAPRRARGAGSEPRHAVQEPGCAWDRREQSRCTRRGQPRQGRLCAMATSQATPGCRERERAGRGCARLGHAAGARGDRVRRSR
jgi:hypothetical protein